MTHSPCSAARLAAPCRRRRRRCPLSGVNDSIPPCAVTIDGRPAARRAPRRRGHRRRPRPCDRRGAGASGSGSTAAMPGPSRPSWSRVSWPVRPSTPQRRLRRDDLRGQSAPNRRSASPCSRVRRASVPTAAPRAVTGSGRAPGSEVQIDDPDVELHHGILDVAVDGGWDSPSYRPCCRSAPTTRATSDVGASRRSICQRPDRSRTGRRRQRRRAPTAIRGAGSCGEDRLDAHRADPAPRSPPPGRSPSSTARR